MVHLPWTHFAKLPYVVCRICGLADVGRVAFQPLTPMFHMLDMRPGQPAYMEQLARAFEALRKALSSLQHDYEASELAIRKPAFMPYPLQDARQVPHSSITATTPMHMVAYQCNNCFHGILVPVWYLKHCQQYLEERVVASTH